MAYSKPSQTCKMKHFAQIVNVYKLVITFVKKLHLRCLEWLWIGHLCSSWCTERRVYLQFLVYGNRGIFAVLSVREQEYICSSWFTGTVICLQFLAYGNMSIGTRLCVLHNGKRFTKSQSNWWKQNFCATCIEGIGTQSLTYYANCFLSSF